MTTKKSLNFEMLRRKWPEIADLGAMAERYVHADPETALVKMRNMIELVVRWLYRQERLPQGFRPNLFAVNLKRRRTKILGVILPNRADPFYMELTRRIEEIADDAGYFAVVLSSGGRPEREAEAIASTGNRAPSTTPRWAAS